MANKAAQNLKAITQDVDQVEDAATALARLTPENDVEQAPGDTADFGTPEAIATAVVASVILGPVGGILVGGAQGWLKKQSDQALLDTIADEQNVLSASADVYSDQLTTFRNSAVNPNDLEQVGAMQTTLDAASKFIGSADKALRTHGTAMLARLDQDMNAYARSQETDRVALETQIAADKRQLGLDQYGRYERMQTDFDTQSAPWLARKEAGNIALAALQDGSPAQIHSAMILFNKALDEGSAVLGEERKAISEMGTLLDTVYNFFGEKFTGQKLNAQQRRDIGAGILTILDKSTAFQLQREAIFQQRAIEDLPTEYIDRFSLADATPGAEPLNIPNDAKDTITNAPGLGGEAAERIMQFIIDQQEKERERLRSGGGPAQVTKDFLANAGETITETAEELRRKMANNFGVPASSFRNRPTN